MTLQKKTALSAILYLLFLIHKVLFSLFSPIEDTLIWYSPISLLLYQFTDTPLSVLDNIAIIWFVLDIAYVISSFFICGIKGKKLYFLPVFGLIYSVNIILLALNVSFLGWEFIFPILAIASSVVLLLAFKSKS